MSRLRPALLLVLVLVLAACGEPNDLLPDPREGRSGIQLSGLLQDRQIAISDGLPVLNTGDCDLNEGPDRDVCIITEDINGELIRIVIENPGVLEEGAVLPIGSDCRTAGECEAVTDMAVIDVQFGTGRRIRAESGTLRMDVVVPFTRYRGDFDLRLPRGSLTATFDLVPRPEELSQRSGSITTWVNTPVAAT